jgi:mRNA interferase MazF
VIIVPLTSKVAQLMPGEFSLVDWQGAGLNVPTAVKRGLFTVQSELVRKSIGALQPTDSIQLEKSLRLWLDLP